VYKHLESEDITGFVDNRDEKIGRKIRDAEVKKIPLMLIVGDKEQENNQVSVRRHGEGDLGSMSIEEFMAFFTKEKAKSLNL
jgi:threonyl-tRNA synthetase